MTYIKSLAFVLVVASGILLGGRVLAVPPYDEEESTSPMGMTHLLPSAYVIPGGTFVLGTSIGVGLFDIFDVSSNLYLDFQQVFNLSSKLGIYHDSDVAVAVFAGYTSQSVKVTTIDPLFGPVQSNVSVVSYSPGAVLSYRISPTLAGHFGGDYVARNPSIPKSSLTIKSGFVQGSTINKEFSYLLSKTVVLSSGVSYDLSYDIWGAGASFHIGGFQIGAHYYFNVSEGAVLPILGGGYSSNF